MEDKSIETIPFEDSVVIEEPTYGLSSFYSLCERGSTAGVYMGICLFLCILPMLLVTIRIGNNLVL